MTEDQIKHMVGRFLVWKLPENFTPDGGISFEKTFNKGTPHERNHEPSGTNLFDGTQAEAMVRHMIAGLAEFEPPLAATIEAIAVEFERQEAVNHAKAHKQSDDESFNSFDGIADGYHQAAKYLREQIAVARQ
jgi:hypothetical protein